MWHRTRWIWEHETLNEGLIAEGKVMRTLNGINLTLP